MRCETSMPSRAHLLPFPSYTSSSHLPTFGLKTGDQRVMGFAYTINSILPGAPPIRALWPLDLDMTCTGLQGGIASQFGTSGTEPGGL